ncbi:helix-turn-helix domain-containing protein [Cytobacillus purgationiresistens]|uniref:Transcriptional regulator with XRE-family HTH domain n=1 Tax=Cytobacillus purgationiresistens TaxID=863449 RepID=A0ABU0AHK9_9BACI|nr:helix-turn-helix transcriptional regulator [Cytobacillus purgationiresistens]MDQ0270746.1 transcriptional regulator with XRE-family HTH domain [Cytobacillus purgationiresistens]
MLQVTPRLTEVLKEKGITQMQLAELSGVPQGSISRFDKNERHVDWHVFAITRALEIDVADLFRVSDAK